jgi:hypothetical protein
MVDQKPGQICDGLRLFTPVGLVGYPDIDISIIGTIESQCQFFERYRVRPRNETLPFM